jgi:uncharacterized membrane protein YgdD (TMEM256/DUF423 family)
MMGWPERILGLLAGLAGLLGVALSAAAAHLAPGQTLDTAARFLLLHAGVLVGLVALLAGASIRPGIGRLAGYAIVLGLVLFSGDLAVRAFFAVPLAPRAAPTGGILLMVGWALIGLATLMRVRG